MGAKHGFSQPDGNARILITTAARWATEIIAPFRAANTDFAEALGGNSQALARGKATALAGLAMAAPVSVDWCGYWPRGKVA